MRTYSPGSRRGTARIDVAPLEQSLDVLERAVHVLRDMADIANALAPPGFRLPPPRNRQQPR